MLLRLSRSFIISLYVHRFSPCTSSFVPSLSQSNKYSGGVHIPQPSLDLGKGKPKKSENDRGDFEHDNHGSHVNLDHHVPFQKYRAIYEELQKKFNPYFIISSFLFGLSLYLAYDCNLFSLQEILPIKSYRAVAEVLKEPITGTITTPTVHKVVNNVETEDTGIPVVIGKLKERSGATSSKEFHTEISEPVNLLPFLSKPGYVEVPKEIPYLLIGSGTASYYASLAIRARDIDAKVLIIGDERQLPYNRPPLSKELWWYGSDNVIDTLEYKTLSGRKRDVFYESKGFYVSPNEILKMKHGGVSLLVGRKVVKLDVGSHIAYLDDGSEIKYGKCLIATGGLPRNHPVIEEAGDDVKVHTTLFRTIEDYRKLDELAKVSKSFVIVGGGFLGSELAYSLKRRHSAHGLQITQICKEKGNMAQVLPEFLSEYTSKQLRNCGINVLTEKQITKVDITKDGRVVLTLDSFEELYADHIIVALGIVPETQLAEASMLEIDKENGGYIVDAELRARSDVYVAGDASSFYDIKLGRRRVEHWEHAQVTGRLAGENMTGAGRPYWHQSSFHSVVAPNVHFQAVGKTDSYLPTVSVFATQNDQYDGLLRGVVFYLNKGTVVGVVLFNVFGNGIDVARRLISDGRKHDDFKEVAKLFDIYEVEEGEKIEVEESSELIH